MRHHGRIGRFILLAAANSYGSKEQEQWKDELQHGFRTEKCVAIMILLWAHKVMALLIKDDSFDGTHMLERVTKHP